MTSFFLAHLHKYNPPWNLWGPAGQLPYQTCSFCTLTEVLFMLSYLFRIHLSHILTLKLFKSSTYPAMYSIVILCFQQNVCTVLFLCTRAMRDTMRFCNLFFISSFQNDKPYFYQRQLVNSCLIYNCPSCH